MASGRIEDSIGKWELVKSIHIPSVVDKPQLRGLISDDEICVTDLQTWAMYITNTSTELTEPINLRDSMLSFTSCAPIDSNVIVCGMEGRDCTGDSLDGCITLYDRQWEVIGNITIPNNSDDTEVHVDVDGNGMILATQYGQSNIYVINPADGKIVNTIKMQGKAVRGDIQALSSGDIVVKTTAPTFTIISRSGEEKAGIHRDEMLVYCSVDKLTDTLYITYRDGKSTPCIDQVSCDGIMQASRIVEYGKSGPFEEPPIGQSFVTPSGNLVVLYGGNLFVYKKEMTA